jgi:hypothetical protein
VPLGTPGSRLGLARLAAALADSFDGVLPDRFGVGGWHAQAVAGEGLCSDGQVVPSSTAAAFTLPSCSASWEARSASTDRNRLAASPAARRTSLRAAAR